jgi:hypothetical protein
MWERAIYRANRRSIGRPGDLSCQRAIEDAACLDRIPPAAAGGVVGGGKNCHEFAGLGDQEVPFLLVTQSEVLKYRKVQAALVGLLDDRPDFGNKFGARAAASCGAVIRSNCDRCTHQLAPHVLYVGFRRKRPAEPNHTKRKLPCTLPEFLWSHRSRSLHGTCQASANPIADRSSISHGSRDLTFADCRSTMTRSPDHPIAD